MWAVGLEAAQGVTYLTVSSRRLCRPGRTSQLSLSSDELFAGQSGRCSCAPALSSWPKRVAPRGSDLPSWVCCLLLFPLRALPLPAPPLRQLPPPSPGSPPAPRQRQRRPATTGATWLPPASAGVLPSAALPFSGQPFCAYAAQTFGIRLALSFQCAQCPSL